MNIDEAVPFGGTSIFDSNLAAFGSGSSGLIIGPGLGAVSSIDAFVSRFADQTSLADAVTVGD